MLTVSKSSAGHASHYYTADNPGQSKTDTIWMGQGAEAMDLAGEVNPELFKQVINGISPEGELLYQRKLISRTDGYDLTFSAPKSVSLLAVWRGDETVLAAHRQAVAHTFKSIEKEAQARMMVNGKIKFLNTKNLVAAAFEHTINRHGDPQLHTHVIVINVTRHRGRWRSFYARKIFQKIKQWGKVYRDRLAQLLVKAGHKLRTAGKEFWEIASMPKAVIKHFSKRRTDIIQKVGADASPAQKQYACLATRPAKRKTPLTKLRQRWNQELKQLTASISKNKSSDRDR